MITEFKPNDDRNICRGSETNEICQFILYEVIGAQSKFAGYLLTSEYSGIIFKVRV